MCNDNVIERLVLIAKARQADSNNHLAGFFPKTAITSQDDELKQYDSTLQRCRKIVGVEIGSAKEAEIS